MYDKKIKIIIIFCIIILLQDPIYVTDTVSVSVTAYNISYNSATTMMVDRNRSCATDVCEYTVTVPSDLCTSSRNISVTLSASNDLGQGAPSNSISIGNIVLTICCKEFVMNPI